MTIDELHKLLERYPADMEVALYSMDFERDYEPFNSEDICSKKAVPFVRDETMVGWRCPERELDMDKQKSNPACEIVVIG